MIQILYMIDTQSFDIFVISAFCFSCISIIFNLFYAISQRLKPQYKLSQQKQQQHQQQVYGTQKVYKMKIVCEKLQSHHRYTHKVLTKSLCSVLGIDNCGDIEVFYVVSARQGIVAYIQVLNRKINSNTYTNTIEGDSSKLNKLSSRFLHISDPANPLNEALKQEINDHLKLNLTQTEPESIETTTTTITTQDIELNDIGDGALIGDKMLICIGDWQDTLAEYQDSRMVKSASATPGPAIVPASPTHSADNHHEMTFQTPDGQSGQVWTPQNGQVVNQIATPMGGLGGMQPMYQMNQAQQEQHLQQMQRQMRMLQEQLQQVQAMGNVNGNFVNNNGNYNVGGYNNNIMVNHDHGGHDQLGNVNGEIEGGSKTGEKYEE